MFSSRDIKILFASKTLFSEACFDYKISGLLGLLSKPTRKIRRKKKKKKP